MPRVVVVTGGAGFIGANLAHHYLGQGDRVVLYDTLGRKGCRENLGWLEDHPNAANLDVLIGDVRLPTRPLQAAIERADALFHLAAQVAVTTCVADPAHDFEINALGTFNVLEAVRKAAERPVVLYSSTNKVYGGMEDVAVVEARRRATPTATCPMASTRSSRSTSTRPTAARRGPATSTSATTPASTGCATVVFRQSCIYGTRQFGIEDQGWIAWFCMAAVTGQPFTIYGDGKQIRDVLWVGDLVDAYQRPGRSNRRGGEVFNIGGGPANTLSLRELVAMLRSRGRPGAAVATPTGGPAISRCLSPTSARPPRLRLAPQVGPRPGRRPAGRLGAREPADAGAPVLGPGSEAGGGDPGAVLRVSTARRGGWRGRAAICRGLGRQGPSRDGPDQRLSRAPRDRGRQPRARGSRIRLRPPQPGDRHPARDARLQPDGGASSLLRRRGFRDRSK